MPTRTPLWCRALGLAALSAAAWCAITVLLAWGVQAPLASVRAAGVGAAPFDDLVAASAGAGAWAALSWLAVGVLTSSVAAVRGEAGRWSPVLARAVAPAALRRCVAGALGVAVIGAGTGLAALPAAAVAVVAPAPATPSTRVAGLPPGWSPDRPVQPVTDPAPAARAPAVGGPGATAGVMVRPGDTLWAIADRALGANASASEVARSWPRWHQVNRAVIGADPSLIRPGQVLRPPG